MGNIYVVDSILYLDSVTMPEGRELHDVIIYPPKHRSHWKHLGRLVSAFYGVPYDLHPRGRVM